MGWKISAQNGEGPLDSAFSLEIPLLRNVQENQSQGHSSSPDTALMVLVGPFQPRIL